MHITQAMEILAPINPRLFAVVENEDNTINAQILTHIPEYPTIQVNDSLVRDSDIMEILEHLDSLPQGIGGAGWAAQSQFALYAESQVDSINIWGQTVPFENGAAITPDLHFAAPSLYAA